MSRKSSAPVAGDSTPAKPPAERGVRGGTPGRPRAQHKKERRGWWGSRGLPSRRSRQGVEMSGKPPAPVAGDSTPAKPPAERVVRDIRRRTRKHHTAEDKIRVVL